MIEHPGLQEMYMETRIAELRADTGYRTPRQPRSPGRHGVRFAVSLPLRSLAALWRSRHSVQPIGTTPAGTPPSSVAESSTGTISMAQLTQQHPERQAQQ